MRVVKTVFHSAGHLGVIVVLCSLASSAWAADDWLDEMPTVPAVVQAAREELSSSAQQLADDEDHRAVSIVSTLMLLRFIMLLQALEDVGASPPSSRDRDTRDTMVQWVRDTIYSGVKKMSRPRFAKLHSIQTMYMQAEVAIGLGAGKRRGYLSQLCNTSPPSWQGWLGNKWVGCYPATFSNSLQWSWRVFRRRILPKLFPCDRAAHYDDLVNRYVLYAPAPYEPSLTLSMPPGYQAPGPDYCTPYGGDNNGNGLCDDWEKPRKAASGATQVSASVCSSSFALIKATTPDAQSIQVTYTISGDTAHQTIRFRVYRSSEPDINASASLIGEESVPTSSSRKSAASYETVILKGHDLPPDMNKPYVVIVGDSGGQTSKTYFRKRLMGVLVHGYTFRYFLELTNALDVVGLITRDWILNNKEVEEWQLDMERSLKRAACYDDATFPFNWRYESVTDLPSILIAKGHELYDKVESRALALAQQHDGDVVDVHFIGHSRGAVIVSVALQKWNKKQIQALKGSYVRVTLLDPHPANNDVPVQEDAAVYYWDAPAVQQVVYPNYLLGGSIYNTYTKFQDIVKDPPVVLPADAGIREIQIYFQHSLVRDIRGHPYLNLWGQGGNNDYISKNNHSKVPIEWHELKKSSDGTAITHSGVVEYYLEKLGFPVDPLWKGASTTEGNCLEPPR